MANLGKTLQINMLLLDHGHSRCAPLPWHRQISLCRNAIDGIHADALGGYYSGISALNLWITSI